MTVTIDKAALIAQVQTIVSNLNLSTDASETLALFYKVADNIRAPTVDIRPTLLSRLETVSSSESLEELLMLIVATSLITPDRSLSVSSVTVLNALTDINPGSIYFVEDVGVPYIKKLNGVWVPIDPLLSPILPVENAYAWGSNAYGQLGDNTVTSRSSPVSVAGGFTDWLSVSASTGSAVSNGNHSLGVRANGSLWAWGSNANGRLGDNTATDRSSPVSVVGGFTDWISASAGNSHSLGVRANGSLWAWGIGGSGRLGDNTVTTRSSPVSVVGGFTDWISASAGSSHNLGVRANGSLWAWGSNSSGQLGDDTATTRSSPVSVVGGFTDWISASAGYVHNLGVRANGTLWAWGNNALAQLGDDTITSRSSPVSVVGGFTDWIQASGGRFHSLGVRANGTLWAWGSGSNGRLGTNNTAGRSSPVSVVGGFTDWIQASAGPGCSSAVRANGTLWAWGLNAQGQLGDNTTTNRSSPVSVVGGFTDWISVTAGGITNDSDFVLGIRSG
jgi:alpha-tubulin suppressor-like RCC1 family protein